ncbi:J domain-containing protein [Hyphomicrobium sp.]|uniref:J domain-containing protein n=1 Tax=Hyphomicrobium sp. TaxID=82 RepID=UPI002E2F7499|nr:J domain-containing protein [Hyphomicrobium sp.]HEX2840338.1 J domain-containing protein [Hyphomicrobium sp.]
MADPYKTLGVSKDATQDEIRKAYRKLAKDTHPDLNPGDAEAERRFKEISGANDILGDPEKRKKFDAGEIDETGAETPQRRYYREYAEADPNMRYGSRTYSSGAGDTFDAEDLFADLFRNRGTGRGGGGGTSFRMPGGDVRYTLPVDFLDAVNGARKTVAMPDGKTLDIEIPAGFREGQVLRLKGQGLPGHGGEPAGDAYVEVHILPHESFSRNDYDIHSKLPISLGEALNGASVRAETVDGAVDVKVPKGAKNGTTLRLRGKGVRRDKAGARGDHLLELVIVPPENPDDELADFMAAWEAKNPQHPRQKRGGRA